MESNEVILTDIIDRAQAALETLLQQKNVLLFSASLSEQEDAVQLTVALYDTVMHAAQHGQTMRAFKYLCVMEQRLHHVKQYTVKQVDDFLTETFISSMV